jgi:hypothetical protein
MKTKTKRMKPKRKQPIKKSDRDRERDRELNLREAATAVLMDHAYGISARVTEGLLDNEEAEESIDLNLKLAGLLGLTKKVKEILPEIREAQCSACGKHLCAVHGGTNG